jgi:hypothetical protein
MGAGDAHVVPEAYFGEEMREERAASVLRTRRPLEGEPFEKLLGIRPPVVLRLEELVRPWPGHVVPIGAY